jgi:hypothetical protein
VLTAEGLDEPALRHLTKLKVDGVKLNATAYAVDYPAGRILLRRAYLAGLEAGRHTFAVELGKAAMETSFTVESGTEPLPPETVEETARAHGIPFRAVHIESMEDAQNAPTPVTTYALFYNGQYLTNEQMNDKKFLKLAGVQIL